nr:hypothetical protein [Gammaproteobacteria bacterium]
MMVVEGLILAAVTFPVTLALGIWYPALTRKYRNNRKSAAFIYGVNAIGACAGALLAGFF